MKTVYRFVCRKKTCRYQGGNFSAKEVRDLKTYFKENGRLPFPCAKCGHKRLKMITVKVDAHGNTREER